MFLDFTESRACMRVLAVCVCALIFVQVGVSERGEEQEISAGYTA